MSILHDVISAASEPISGEHVRADEHSDAKIVTAHAHISCMFYYIAFFSQHQITLHVVISADYEPISGEHVIADKHCRCKNHDRTGHDTTEHDWTKTALLTTKSYCYTRAQKP